MRAVRYRKLDTWAGWDANATISWYMRPFAALLLWLFVSLADAASAPEVAIGTLLADPLAYHMKVVTLSGTSHQVQALQDPPHQRPTLDYQCYLVHPPYTFVLADDTGFLQVTVTGRPPCVSQQSPAERPDVSEGETVQVEAHIRVTPVYRDGMATQSVEAHAVGIRRLNE